MPPTEFQKTFHVVTASKSESLLDLEARKDLPNFGFASFSRQRISPGFRLDKLVRISPFFGRAESGTRHQVPAVRESLEWNCLYVPSLLPTWTHSPKGLIYLYMVYTWALKALAYHIFGVYMYIYHKATRSLWHCQNRLPGFIIPY